MENKFNRRSFLATSSSMIELRNESSIIIFPNPLFTSILNIGYRNIENITIEQIQLKNINGGTVKTFEIKELPEQLVLDDVASGTYFLYFKSPEKSYNTKIVIAN